MELRHSRFGRSEQPEERCWCPQCRDGSTVAYLAIIGLPQSAPWDAELAVLSHAGLDRGYSGDVKDRTAVEYSIYQWDPRTKTRHHRR